MLMTNKHLIPLNECLCCGEENLFATLDLGRQALANAYRLCESDSSYVAPLAVNTCPVCWHTQLAFGVNPELLFTEYAYSSGTSGALAEFFKWFASSVKNTFGDGCHVLDIAANDGSQLGEFKKIGISNVVGIDPAKNQAELAALKGIHVINDFWPQAAGSLDEKFDVIVCQNVLGHVLSPKLFMEGVMRVLKDDGVVLIQPSQARMLPTGQFDAIYHEHVSFFNTSSMSQLLNRVGLELVDAVFTKVHGDSVLYFAQKKNAVKRNFSAFKTGEFYIAESVFDYENQSKIFERVTYEVFRKRATEVIESLDAVIKIYRSNGYQIALVGAAAKAMTVVQKCEFDPDLVFDEAPLKINKFLPNLNVRISHLDDVKNIDSPVLFIISAWNFYDNLAVKIASRCNRVGSGDFLVLRYFPELEIRDLAEIQEPVD